MNFVRALLLAILVAAITLFAVANSQMLPLDFGFVQLEVWLPLIVLVAFLLGFVPVWARLSADRIVLRRRVRRLEEALATAESALAQARVELLRPPSAPPVSAAAPPVEN
jgi:uncharacterized integral membrane protein